MEKEPIPPAIESQNPDAPVPNRKCAREGCSKTFHPRTLKKYCSAYCSEKARKQRYDKKYPEKLAIRMKRLGYRRRHGRTPEEIEATIQEQGVVCPIGNHPFGSSRGDSPVQDHSHITKMARSVICSRHNLALGSFNDSPEELEAAAEYLRHWLKNHTEIKKMLVDDE